MIATMADQTMTRQGWPQVVWRLALVFGFGLLVAVMLGEVIISAILPGSGDYLIVRDATRHWLAGGQYYPTYELQGPFIVGSSDILYPPLILPLLVVFSYLPDIAWWLAPMGVLGAVFFYWRPSLLGWTLVLLVSRTRRRGSSSCGATPACGSPRSSR